MNGEKEVLFQVKNLKTYFPVKEGLLKKVTGNVKAVDGVSFEVYRGETLGVVGESGCGKSTMGKTVMRLLNPTDGEILYRMGGEMKDVAKFNKKELFDFRKEVQMVFQDPYSALNPSKKIGEAFEEPLKIHGIKDQKKRQGVTGSGI